MSSSNYTATNCRVFVIKKKGLMDSRAEVPVFVNTNLDIHIAIDVSPHSIAGYLETRDYASPTERVLGIPKRGLRITHRTTSSASRLEATAGMEQIKKKKVRIVF